MRLSSSSSTCQKTSTRNQYLNTLKKTLILICISMTVLITGCKPWDPDALPDKLEFKESIINLKGEFVIKPIYDGIGTYSKNGQFSASQKLPRSQDNGQNGYDIVFDLNGHEYKRALLEYGLDWKESFQYKNDDFRRYTIKPLNENPNFVPVLQNGKYGFKNKSGVWIIRPQWDYVLGFEHNVCFVWNYDHPFSRWGLIDSKGHYLLKPTCVAIDHFDPELPLRLCRIPFTFDGKQL